MAKRKNTRADGLYQKVINLGRRPDGTYNRKIIYGRTQADLDKKVNEYMQKLNDGIDMNHEKTTFGDMAKLHMSTFGDENWATYKKGIINNHLLPDLQNIKVTDVKAVHLDTILKRMDKNGYATGTMSKVKDAAWQIMELACGHEAVRKNVFSNVKVPAKDAMERRPLSQIEFDLLTTTCNDHRFGYAAMIMLYAGLRRGELIALQWKCVDLTNKTITVDKAVTYKGNLPELKGPKSKAGNRTIIIPDVLVSVLKEIKPNDDFVCPSNKGGMMSKTEWLWAWKDYCSFLNEQLGGKRGNGRGHKTIQVLNHITPHMLRHTYATLLYDANADIKTAQKYLGHSKSSTTTDIYIHLSNRRENMSVTSLNEHLNTLLHERKSKMQAELPSETPQPPPLTR